MHDSREKALAPAAAVRAASAPSTAGNEALDQAMQRYARGDDGAFNELYRRAGPRVRGFLLRLCGDAALADDLTQDAFLRAHRARGSFETGAAALPWLFAIGRNAFVDHKRRQNVRRMAVEQPLGEPRAEPEAASDTRGDEVLAGREALDVVRATLAQMSVLQREAFVLLRFEGLSVTEAAQVLGASEAAVKVRAFRAYETLRAALDRPGDGSR